MFCFYYRYQIQRYMDQHQAPDNPGLRRHLSTCAGCRDYLNRMARLNTQMKESVCGPLSNAALQKIEASVLHSIGSFPAGRQQTGRARIWIPYAAAACFVIVAGLSGWSYRMHHRNMQARTAANNIIASLNGAAAFSDSGSLVKLLTEQSTQKELDKLVNNAQNAVTYITNCIPQSPLEIMSEGPDN